MHAAKDQIGDNNAPPTYQATYRKSELVLPGLLVILLLFAAGMFAIFRYRDSWNFETTILSLAGFTFLSLAILMNAGFRTNRWTVLATGIGVLEQPRLRWTGFSRRWEIGFADIAVLRRIESGLDQQIELMTIDGRSHRLSQAYLPAGRQLALPRPAPVSIHDFAEVVRAAAARAGHRLPEMAEGLSFWNAAPGLALLTTALGVSLVLSGGLVWAFVEGLTLEPRARGGEAAAILLLLPIGAGYLLRKCWLRRRIVLAALAARRSG